MTGGVAIPPVIAGRNAPPRRRCARHEEREAVGRCVECGAGFCRECITEHDGKLYCGPCYTRKAEAGRSARVKGFAKRGWLKPALLTAGSLVCVLVTFYLLGRLLSAIPANLHDGTIWKETLTH